LNAQDAGDFIAERIDVILEALIEHVANHDHSTLRPLSHPPEIGVIELSLAPIPSRERIKQDERSVQADASAGAAEQILEPMLIEFLRQHPGMRLDIRADDALIDIASGGFDCGLRQMELVPEGMVGIPVGPEQQHIVVAAPYIWKTHRIFPHRPI
jgi:DNA-binding transcriptional LysR family regulator